MTHGRTFEKGKQFGRPKSSCNQRALLANKLLDEYIPALVRIAVTIAFQGDKGVLRADPQKTARLPNTISEETRLTCRAIEPAGAEVRENDPVEKKSCL
jgi:hypothetical protein